MPRGASLVCDTVIRGASVLDGTGASAEMLDVAITGDTIAAMGMSLDAIAERTIDGRGLTLAPGFIDTHTHDDTSVIRMPEMLPKISQGVTTVIVGNCGISAAPVTLYAEPPDPMNLLGGRDAFVYPTFASYVAAIRHARPAVNVAALVGHTSLRCNQMAWMQRAATGEEIAAMRTQLREALAAGALGLSTGLAYRSAELATTDEVIALAEPLSEAGAIYTTHLRSETAAILDALAEAFTIGRASRVPVVVSHLKCAGIDNWGRSGEVLQALDEGRAAQPVGCDCYPYAAGSSTLDLRQVDERVRVTVTWSEPHPEMAGQPLQQIANAWQVSQMDAARRLQPAGAIYHSIDEQDMRRILKHPATMIGSDGLPNDPRPHPRLWGTFPRVLGRYCRDEKLFTLATAVHKMTGLPAERFGLTRRGVLCVGHYADLVLFDAARIRDNATYAEPTLRSTGIEAVWVNGTLTYTGSDTADSAVTERNGRYLARDRAQWKQ